MIVSEIYHDCMQCYICKRVVGVRGYCPSYCNLLTTFAEQMIFVLP